MKLRTQMQPNTILLRPSETLHDGTKNGRTTKSHKINISSCSPKKRNKMCLLQRRRRKCNNSELVSSAKKATTVKSCGISCSFSKFSTANKIWSEFSTNRIWSETWRKKNSFLIISTMSSDLGLKYIFWKALPYFRQWNQCTLATNPVTTMHPIFSYTILIATKVPFQRRHLN